MAVATAREGIARETVDAVPRVVAPALERAASPSRADDEIEKARLEGSRDADLNRLAALGDAPTETDDASAEDVVETPDTKVFPALGAKPDADNAADDARAARVAARVAERKEARLRDRLERQVDSQLGAAATPGAGALPRPGPKRVPSFPATAETDAGRGARDAATTTSRFSATTTTQRRRRAAAKARARLAARAAPRLGARATARATMRLATSNPTTRPTTRTALTATRTAPAA